MLPTNCQLRLAVEHYLRQAYQAEPPGAVVAKFLPAEDDDLGAWLMRDVIERDPADAPLAQVRSFAMRMGNRQYPFMKIRLTRPPRQPGYIFTVDAHDAMLHAPPGSADVAQVEQLKQLNAHLSREVLAAWDAAGLPNERSYMRDLIARAKHGPPPTGDTSC